MVLTHLYCKYQDFPLYFPQQFIKYNFTIGQSVVHVCCIQVLTFDFWIMENNKNKDTCKIHTFSYLRSQSSPLIHNLIIRTPLVGPQVSILHESIDGIPYTFNKSLRQDSGQLKSTKFLKLLASTNISMQLMSRKCHAKELKGI